MVDRQSLRNLPWKRIGAVLVVALPLFLFLPGIGFEASHPASLARQNGADGIWYYRVREGDVLTRIAERELGTLRRHKEISALNPGIKPRALVIDSVLRMPPRDPASATGGSSRPGSSGAPAHDGAAGSPSRLLLAFAALLGLVMLVVAAAGHMERRAARN